MAETRQTVQPKRQTLYMLYHSLIYSRSQNGILVWGTTSKTYLRESMVRLNNIVRIITFSRYCSRMSSLYKSIYLLKLTDIFKLELAKFLCGPHNECFPKFFYDSLTKLESVHDHNTKQLTKNIYFKYPLIKNIDKKTILYRGGSLGRNRYEYQKR